MGTCRHQSQLHVCAAAGKPDLPAAQQADTCCGNNGEEQLGDPSFTYLAHSRQSEHHADLLNGAGCDQIYLLRNKQILAAATTVKNSWEILPLPTLPTPANPNTTLIYSMVPDVT